ncbi:MAG: hypothetical protein IJC18_00160, partial [Clostridia bacterium]|nr:hypothetical protein [Clostridia bacterium]
DGKAFAVGFLATALISIFIEIVAHEHYPVCPLGQSILSQKCVAAYHAMGGAAYYVLNQVKRGDYSMCLCNLFDNNDNLMWILLLIIVALGCGCKH